MWKFGLFCFCEAFFFSFMYATEDTAHYWSGKQGSYLFLYKITSRPQWGDVWCGTGKNTGWGLKTWAFMPFSNFYRSSVKPLASHRPHFVFCKVKLIPALSVPWGCCVKHVRDIIYSTGPCNLKVQWQLDKSINLHLFPEWEQMWLVTIRDLLLGRLLYDWLGTPFPLLLSFF